MGLNNFAGGCNPPSNGNPPGGMPSGGNPFNSVFGTNQTDATEYLINYNDKFKVDGNCLFRDEIVKQTIATLIGKNKPNALLVGPAGVGKTKIVEDIAYRLANNDALIPDTLKGYTIYELPLSNIVAGSGIVGQVEEKIKDVIEFITDKKNKAIMFIDEIHQLVGDSQTYEKIAQILKPALARGDIKVIGATTVQEAVNLTEDPAFNRRFSRIIVDELSREQTIEILRKSKASFITHYANKIAINDDILETIAILADQYKTAGSHRPDNAITLLDRTLGGAIVARKAQEKKAIEQNDTQTLQLLQSSPIIPITELKIRKTAVKLMTGCNTHSDLDIDHLIDSLSTIKGQDDIITTIVKHLRNRESNLFPKEKPMVLLFAGPSGVGKTEVTKIIANELTDMKPITLNMTEYHSSASINRIIGAPAGYVGSDSHGELPFDNLESNPYQVILLDEFEKGNPAVQKLFYSAFDEGYIKTSNGRIIDFSKSIIIATTNAGHTERKSSMGFTSANKTDISKSDKVNMLSKWFDLALLNRFEDIIVFNELSKDIYKEILIDKYHREITRIRAEKNRVSLLDDIPDDKLEEIINKTYIPEFGARPVEKAVREYIEEQAFATTNNTQLLQKQ